MALALAACSAPRPTVRPPPAAAVAAGPAVSRDPADDWRRLLIAPLGTHLQDMPATLQEALFFHDAAGTEAGGVTPAAASGAGECYTPRGALPAFAGDVAESFVLCFTAERLSLIEAARAVPRAAAAGVLQQYCDLWQGNSRGDARTAASCSGHDGDTAFTALLELGEADQSGRFALRLYPVSGAPR